MIKEYGDRIREEIKNVNKELDSVRANQRNMSHESYDWRISRLNGYIDGLNKALDIYLDLVKEDL